MVMEGNIMMNNNEMKSFQQCKHKRDSLGIIGVTEDETYTFRLSLSVNPLDKSLIRIHLRFPGAIIRMSIFCHRQARGNYCIPHRA